MKRSIEYQGPEHGYVQHPEIIRKASITVAGYARDKGECEDFLEMLGLLEPIDPLPKRSGTQQRTIYKMTEEQRAEKAKSQRERRARRRAEGKKPT